MRRRRRHSISACVWTYPEITTVGADRAYAGKLVIWAKRHLNLTIKTVSRLEDTSGSALLPRRWLVETSVAWIMHTRDTSGSCGTRRP